MTKTTLQALSVPTLAALTLIASAAVTTAQAQDAPSGSASRPCRGTVTTLVWGAYVGDADGRCTPAAAPARPTVRVTRPTVEVGRPEACSNERRWLGGAVILCRDAPAQGKRR